MSLASIEVWYRRLVTQSEWRRKLVVVVEVSVADVWSAGPAVGVLDSIFLRMHAMQKMHLRALAQQQRGGGGEHSTVV